MNAQHTTRLERRARLRSSDISALDHALLLVDIATDPDEPALTADEATHLAARLLRRAVADERIRLALEECEPMAEDVASIASDLLELMEAVNPDEYEHLDRLEALAIALTRLSRR